MNIKSSLSSSGFVYKLVGIYAKRSLNTTYIMELQVNAEGLPVLDQFSEDGFVDCVLKIRNLTRETGHIRFHMAATFNGEEVGVDVCVVTGIKAGFNEEMELNRDHVYKDGVQFMRSGPESDRLLAAISGLYGFDPAGRVMVEKESFTAIALHQDEIDMETHPVKIKIFGKDREIDDEDDYYESFFNLDLPNELVFWNEKDEDYREPLVRSLSGKIA